MGDGFGSYSPGMQAVRQIIEMKLLLCIIKEETRMDNNHKISVSTGNDTNNFAESHKKIKTFEIPSCKFCYPCCGTCRWSSNVNFSLYCNRHEQYVSYSDGPCGDYS